MGFIRKAFCLILFLLAVPSVFAVEYGGVGGYPAHPDPENSQTNQWFIYTLNPGETVEDELIVENTSDEAVSVKLYPADYTVSTDGGFALEQEVESRDDVGKWVTLSSTGVTIDARSQVVVPFTLTVPDDPSIDVGDHMGGILIQKIDTGEEISEYEGVQINLRVGVRIYVTIPGEVIEAVELGDLGFSVDLEKRIGTVTTTVKNTGNVGENVIVSTSVENVYSVFDAIFRDFPFTNKRALQVLRDDELVSNFEFNLPWLSYVKTNSRVEYVNKSGESVLIESVPLYMWIFPPLKWTIITGACVIAFLVFLLVLVRGRGRRNKYFY